jgi:hypothetical protein
MTLAYSTPAVSGTLDAYGLSPCFRGPLPTL